MSESLPVPLYLDADYSISFGPFACWLFALWFLALGQFALISTSAEEGLGLWMKANFKGSASLSLNQTQTANVAKS